jgi:peptidyl-prolyl cis-trans isomerase D
MAGIQNIRDNLGSPFVKILTAAIVITFALFFGWGTVFSTSDANTVASINGKKIDVYDLDLEMVRVQSILNQRFDDPNFNVEAEILKSLALNSLIRDSLVLDFLESHDVEVSNLTAYKLLAKNEAFKEEGQFSIQKVDTFARQNGFLPGKYLESIRDDIALNFWRVGLSDSYFITSNELNHNIKLANQTRDITFLKLDKSEMEEDLEAAKENVLDFYNQNPSLFKTEEKAKIRFIQISLEDLGNIESISKEDVEQEYQAYLETFDSTIRRYASHLMINITIERHKQDAISLANDLRKKLESGENFESLIKEYSEDEGTKNSDGFLGVSDGSAFSPEFELALEVLEKGEVSQPIVLESSVHLLKLTDIQKPTPEKYNLIQEKLKENLIEQIAYQEFTDLLELAADLTFSLDNLELLSEELKLEIKTKDFFSRTEAEGIFKESILLDAIFNDSTIKKGNLSELIEIDDQNAIILEVTNFQEQETKGFEVVEEEAKTKLIDELSRERLESLQSKILGLLEQGSSLDDVSKENKIKVQTYKSVTRDSSLFTRNVLLEIFNEPRSNLGKFYSSVSFANGDILIFRLDGVQDSSQEFVGEQKESLKNFFLAERSESELADLRINMQEVASVVIN